MDRASQPLFDPLQDPDRMTTVGAMEADDGTYYVLENDTNESLGPDTEELDVRTLVREDALVRQTVFERITETDSDRVSVTHTVEIDDIGETDVEPPDWADEPQSTDSE